jgi:multiple sugar transport system substrate-binding protein
MSGVPRHFTGLTWDHPRGYDALAAAAERTSGLICWAKQPLEGFESHPIAELARAYDLLVFDHPHIGEAVAHDCLVPLEELFSDEILAAWQHQTVGSATKSYYWQGRHWGVPLDVATQVMAYRPDLVGKPPASWSAVIRLAEQRSVAVSVAGPHAILNFFSLCLAHGETPATEELVSDAVGTAALEILHRLYGLRAKGSEVLNPIGLLRTMATSDSIAVVPLVYGYVNYARPLADQNLVAFANAPTGSATARGSVLGGTGIAVTRRARYDAALLDHIAWLMSKDAQARFIPDHNGKPSARAAWQDEGVNALWRGFYRATLLTTEHAWVRPRFNGYIAYQTAAAGIVREALADDTPAHATLSALRQAWRRRQELGADKA